MRNRQEYTVSESKNLLKYRKQKSENKFELMKKGPIYAIISSWQHYDNTKSEG